MNSTYDLLVHIPSLHGGGAERVAVDIASYFNKSGFRVVLFVHHRKWDYEVPSGVVVHTATSTSHFGRVFELRRLLKKTGVPIIFSLLPYANLVSVLARVGLRSVRRLVVSEHLSYSVLKPRGVKERFKLGLALALYRKADALVAVSTGVATELKSRVDVRTARNVTVIYNPCFVPDALACVHPNQQGKRGTILAVGRLVHQKGFDTLIRAFARAKDELGDVVLRIIGEGPDHQKLEALAGELGIGKSVTLPGFTKDIGSEYANADLFVCASRAEGFGNVIVEALSYGMKVVSTSCPFGPDEILDGGRFGALVRVDAELELAAAIVEQYRNPANPQRQVQRAREFSIDSIGAQYASVLEIKKIRQS
jgi:glycosyltransferase involved in cell wall biosynthesis